MQTSSRGFTLIELLVVIAIIGVLSSVVLASLNSARLRARDAAVKSGVRQLATLMHLEYNETGSYAALQSGWENVVGDCANSFSGTYATNARQMCVDIVENINTTNALYTGNNVSLSTTFSVMGRMPSNGHYFCIGSSGRSSTGPSSGTGGSWLLPGCYANP